MTGAFGQKKPTTLKLDVDGDDEKLCRETSLKDSQFCDLFNIYDANKDGNDIGKAKALNARNDMVNLVIGQVDTYFKLRKDGRRSRIRFYQTILDFLRIGGELAVTIMNGERAKTIIGASLAALDTSRTKFDENFQILQTQVLVNKMIEKRARIMTEMVVSMDKPVRAAKASDAYSWYQAKNDLRRYLLAGTFDDALDTLVEESGEDAAKAKADLKAVTKTDVEASRAANTVLVDLSNALDDPAKKDAATKTLKNVVIELNKDDAIKARLTTKNITEASDGKAIFQALFEIRGDFIRERKKDLVEKINKTVNDLGGTLDQ